MSGQRNLTKSRIAPALVTPAAGESILKPRFHPDPDVLPLRTVYRPAMLLAGAFAISTVISMAEQFPNCPFSWEIRDPRNKIHVHGS